MLKGLKAIILERFHPGQYLPMILVFTLANAMYFNFSYQENLTSFRLVLTFMIMCSAFFRLRLFDEIKDYQTDLKINPTRPLARHAISITDTKKVILILIGFELALAFYLGLNPFLFHALALTYSLLMYEEFFIGESLRPHLTTYAITHTFVSVLLGLSASTLAHGNQNFSLEASDGFFFLMNWAYFNLFEFARKTYALKEERMGVDTYSSLFKPIGAGILSLSQVGIGLWFISKALPEENLNPLFIAGAIYSLFCFNYIFRPEISSAKLFRHISGAYLLIHYIILIWIFWR